MPEQDPRTGELEKAQKVLDMIFPPGHETAGVVEPGEETFDFPPALDSAKRPTVLRLATPSAVCGDHLDAVASPERRVERVAVVAAVADQSRRELGEEARVEGGGDEVGLIRRSAGHVHGERKTMAVADRHDFAPFTTAGRANGSAPFFAPGKV